MASKKSDDLKRTTTGRPLIDDLSENHHPSIDDYVAAVSDYVIGSGSMAAGQSKQAQIALSAALARALCDELTARVPRMKPHAGELNVAGALRNAQADVSEAHPLDGLRLAIELKPVNLAVGRAIWNRFGDVRAFAVNIHLKFPFAVVGGVLAVPTWEWSQLTKAMRDAAAVEAIASVDGSPHDVASELTELDGLVDAALPTDAANTSHGGEATTDNERQKKSTQHLVDRLVRRLARTRRRETEADPAHLLEAIAVIIYDPDLGVLNPDVPAPGSGLRWSEFVDTIADQYDVRFED